MSNFYDEDPRRYRLISEALRDFPADISPSDWGSTADNNEQSQRFWRKLYAEYIWEDTDEARVKWLKEEIADYFRYFDKPPAWIQGKDWQFAGDVPMIFVGQLDVKRTPDNLAGEIFHDDVSYYIFIPNPDFIEDDNYHPDRMIMQRW